MLPAALCLCPGVTSMPSSLLCLERNPNRHSREPVQRDLGCPLKQHDTIYNVSHKNTDVDTGHNLMLQMGRWGSRETHAVLEGEGLRHFNSSVFCSIQEIACLFLSPFTVGALLA